MPGIIKRTRQPGCVVIKLTTSHALCIDGLAIAKTRSRATRNCTGQTTPHRLRWHCAVHDDLSTSPGRQSAQSPLSAAQAAKPASPNIASAKLAKNRLHRRDPDQVGLRNKVESVETLQRIRASSPSSTETFTFEMPKNS